MSATETADIEAISLQSASKLLAVSVRTTWRQVRSGELKAHRIGRQWRIFRKDLNDYLIRQSNRQAA